MQARRLPEGLHALGFLSPFLAFNLVFLIYPFFLGIWMSFHRWDLIGGGRAMIGIKNFTRMLTDELFWSSVGHTLAFALLAVPSITATALLLAIVLNSPLRRSAVLRGIFFASGVFSVTVVTLIWLSILNPSRGLVGLLIQLLGRQPIDFLADTRFAMPALVLTTLWWSVGLPLAIFVAGLQQIPQELYEAAELDRASRWQAFRQITLPSLRRTTWLVVILQIILQLQVFGQVLLMTRGGPAYSTHVLVQYIYEASFRDWEVGYASAMSVFLLFLMVGFSWLQYRLGGREGARA